MLFKSLQNTADINNSFINKAEISKKKKNAFVKNNWMNLISWQLFYYW